MCLKLYETDSHLTACSARVLSCEKVEGGYDLRLDQTVFFPEEGGQPCDLGTAGSARVLDVQLDNGDILHRIDAPLAVGSTVALSIDWARRFEFMQQHTGEHLLSFAFFKLFGAHNVGFHLAETDYTTIDFDLPLTGEQLQSAQHLANTYIWRDLPVTAQSYTDMDAVAALPLRKHADGLIPPIRIVAIEDADMCTCCAPHCARTGEIGSILITDAAAYKGGTRIFFVCGVRALRHAAAEHEALDTIARRFSINREQAAQAVEKLSADFAASRHSEKQLTAQLNAYLRAELVAAAEPVGTRKLILRLLDGVDTARLKPLAQGVLDAATLCVLLSRQDGRLSYVVASQDGFSPDAGEIIQAVNAATGGKGGGRGGLAQGMAASDAGAGETLAQLRHYLGQRLKQS